MSSARLAALYPQSGGTYVYGRERLGPFWGYLAGWAFVVGKLASCAAMALAVGAYAWPGHDRLVAVLAVAALTSVNYMGVQKSAQVTRWIVIVVLTVLATVVITSLSGENADAGRLAIGTDVSARGVLQAGGLLFFAFAGYARIATLGAEVRDPQRTIPRAISISLLMALAVYAVVAIAVLSVLGPEDLAASAAPLVDAVDRAGVPAALTAVHPRFGVPHRAEIAVGLVVMVMAATVDLRGAIGFSSFGVLTYYAIANASAWTLTRAENRPPRAFPVIGLLGCTLLAFALPLAAVITGAAVVLLGAAIYPIPRSVHPGPSSSPRTGGKTSPLPHICRRRTGREPWRRGS